MSKALIDATLSAMVEVERLGRHYTDAEGVMVLEIRTGRLNTIIKTAIEKYAAEMLQALNYVADMTYCGADADWHFKPEYDPQIVLDALEDK